MNDGQHYGLTVFAGSHAGDCLTPCNRRAYTPIRTKLATSDAGLTKVPYPYATAQNARARMFRFIPSTEEICNSSFCGNNHPKATTHGGCF